MTAAVAQEAAAPALAGVAGARFGRSAEGLAVVRHFGDPRREQRVLVESCGLVERGWAGHLELTGEDRQRYLNGLVTPDVRRLEPGRGAWGYCTSARGRVLAEARIEARADRLELELPAAVTAAMAEHLGRYLVADRVEIRPAPDRLALSLAGPAADETLRRAAAELEPPVGRWGLGAATIAGVAVGLAREERLGVDAVTLRLARSAAAPVVEALVGAGAVPAGFDAAEVVRVEAGMARFGPDFDAECLPQEIGEAEALDFEKGCYLGQEIVARIHYRGEVNRRLVGLRLDAGEPPASGATVRHGDREVGRLGSVAVSPRLGAIGLAVLHRRAALGDEVEIESGAQGLVVGLPFAEAP